MVDIIRRVKKVLANLNSHCASSKHYAHRASEWNASSHIKEQSVSGCKTCNMQMSNLSNEMIRMKGYHASVFATIVNFPSQHCPVSTDKPLSMHRRIPGCLERASKSSLHRNSLIFCNPALTRTA